MYNNMNNNNYLGFNNSTYNPMMYPQAYPNYNNYVQQDRQPNYRPQNINPINQNNNFLQGKVVDSIEVIRAMEIPLDGSITFFPLADGTAIVTKQLQNDGTSKIVTYKPLLDDNIPKEKIEEKVYVTEEEFEKRISNINNFNFEDDIKIMQKEIEKLNKEIEKLKEIKEVKAGKK